MSEMDYASPSDNSYIARIISFSSMREKELSLLASDCGLEIAKNSNNFLHQNWEENRPHNECLLIDFPSISDKHSQDLDRLSSYIECSNVKAFVWTDLDGLDAAFAVFSPANCHFLAGSCDVEAAMLLTGELRRGNMDQLHDQSRDEGYDELHKISNDLANVARSLSQIVGNEEDGQRSTDTNSGGNGAEQNSGGSLAEKPVSFRPAPNRVPTDNIFPQGSQSGTSENGLSAKSIRNLIKLRRLREQHFDTGLFADPAWDILLDLMAARLENIQVSVSSLCIAASVPPTTALRWIATMSDNGLLERQQDPNDARRVFLQLSDETAQKMEEYFSRAGQLGGKVI